MALAIDGSTPAKVTGTTTAITTASFSPPSGSALLAAVVRNWPNPAGGTSADGTVTSTGGLSWTLAGRKSLNATSTNGTGQDACAEIWVTYASSAPGSITVTDTRGTVAGVSGDAGNEHLLKVTVLTGAESTWGGAVAGASSASGLPSVNVTTSRAGSWVFAASSDWAQKGLGTAGGSQTIVDEMDVVGQITGHVWRQTSTTPSSGTVVTSNLTAPAAQQYNALAIEIRAALTVAADSAGPFLGSPPGRISPSGRWTRFPFDATPSGQTVGRSFAGSVTPTGALALATTKALAGASTPTGALAKAVTKPGLVGSSTPRGALAKQANKALAGSSTPTSVLAAVKVVLRNFAGSVTPTGTLTRQASKALAGSVTSTGSLARQTGKALAGAVTATGTLTKSVAKAFAGSVTATGVLSAGRVIIRAFAGSSTPTGALSRLTGKALAGSSTPGGALARAVSKALTGAVTAVGVLAKLIAKPFAGSSTPTGGLTATNQGATQNATSAAAVAELRTSTPDVAADRTSSPGVTGTRTSSPTVSDG